MKRSRRPGRIDKGLRTAMNGSAARALERRDPPRAREIVTVGRPRVLAIDAGMVDRDALFLP